MPVIYLILFIVSLFFYILYKGVFSFYLFAFFIAVPIILFCLYLYAANKIKLSIIKSSKIRRKDENIPVNIEINNPTFIPISGMTIFLEIYSKLDGDKNVIKVCTPVYPRDKQYLSLIVSPAHCGGVRCKIVKCRIHDLLRLFSFKIKNLKRSPEDIRWDFFAVPEYIPINNNIENSYHLGIETDEYSKQSKGDDPTEIFDIREYSAGDKISRIHWKLSAKQDSTMVKDYSLPITNSILLVFDPCIDKSKEGYMEQYDALLEAVVTISRYLSENSTGFSAVWFTNGNMKLMNITNEEECTVFIEKLIYADVYDSDKNIAALLEDSESDLACGHMIYFSSKYNESITAALYESAIALKYSYMLGMTELSNEKITDEFAKVYQLSSGSVPVLISSLNL